MCTLSFPSITSWVGENNPSRLHQSTWLVLKFKIILVSWKVAGSFLYIWLNRCTVQEFVSFVQYRKFDILEEKS